MAPTNLACRDCGQAGLLIGDCRDEGWRLRFDSECPGCGRRKPVYFPKPTACFPVRVGEPKGQP
jgi:hypothetical protein